MIIKIFHQGERQGDFIINYLLSREKHQGYDPAIIKGDPTVTNNIINSLAFKNKYTVGCLSFRTSETLTTTQQHELIESFEKTFAPFDDSSRVNFLWVKHFDKGRLELNFLMPRCCFMPDGSVKSFNIHPPGKSNLLFFEAFTRLENDYYGFEQVDRKKFGCKNKNFYMSVFDDLHEQRKKYILENYSKTRTTIRKVIKNGRFKVTSGFAVKNAHFRNIANFCKLKIERIREEQRFVCKSANRNNGCGWKDDESYPRTEGIPKHTFNAPEISNRLAQVRMALGAISAPMSIDDEMYHLGVQLSSCSASQAPSIQARLNFLQGMRSRQENGGQKFKPK